MALGLGSVDVPASTLGESTRTPIAAGKLWVSQENCCIINEKACIVFLQDYKEYPSHNWDTKIIPVRPQWHEIICPLNLKDINPEVFISRVISISTPFCTQTVAFFCCILFENNISGCWETKQVPLINLFESYWVLVHIAPGSQHKRACPPLPNDFQTLATVYTNLIYKFT